MIPSFRSYEEVCNGESVVDVHDCVCSGKSHLHLHFIDFIEAF